MPEATANHPLPARAEQFDDLDQQTETAHLGMWLFLGTEILFFGGLFTAYMVFRCTYPHVFADASRELSIWAGTADTAILLTSSLTMVLAIHALRVERRTLATLLLLATAAVGTGFLLLHGFEYFQDYKEQHWPGQHFFLKGPAAGNKAQLFFFLYFCLTGLHSLHVLIGVAAITLMAYLAWRKKFTKDYFTPVEVTGLYWHFVDMVWVFIFPLFYLIDRH